jgi:hypothetical protein
MKPADPRLELLVGIARELAEVSDYDAAVRLMTAFGGQRIFVPARIRPKSRLYQVLGPHAAQELAKLIAPLGKDIDVPLGGLINARARRRALANLVAAQEQLPPAERRSKNQIAAEMGIHYKTVQKARHANREQRALSHRGAEQRLLDQATFDFEALSKRP